MRAYMAGLRADVSDGIVIFEPGSFTSAGSDNKIYDVDSNINVNPAIVGPGGADRAGLWSNGEGMFFYFLAAPDKTIVGLCSPAYEYGQVIVPDGHTLLRKHPFMCCWNTLWGGIAPFHFEGIQNPRIRLSAPVQIAALTHAPTVPAIFNISPYVPVQGGARMLLLRYIIAPAGREGTGYIGYDTAHLMEIGPANPAMGGGTNGYLEQRCESDGTFAYMVNAPGITIKLFLEGYVITEVTN